MLLQGIPLHLKLQIIPLHVLQEAKEQNHHAINKRSLQVNFYSTHHQSTKMSQTIGEEIREVIKGPKRNRQNSFKFFKKNRKLENCSQDHMVRNRQTQPRSEIESQRKSSKLKSNKSEQSKAIAQTSMLKRIRDSPPMSRAKCEISSGARALEPPSSEFLSIPEHRASISVSPNCLFNGFCALPASPLYHPQYIDCLLLDKTGSCPQQLLR